MGVDDYKRFEDLTFDDFRRMAKDETLSPYEKVGFPNAYREGKEQAIWSDILAKLPALGGHNKVVLDIGPGCSQLPSMLIDHCQRHGHRLLLIDSAEMLEQLPSLDFIEKYSAIYPDCPQFFEKYLGKVDVILTYSVSQYVFADGNIWNFLDKSLQLLAHRGEMLIGDIPNASKRKRFFSSPAGVDHHRAFSGDAEATPPLVFNEVQPGQMDDSVVLGLLHRARLAGCDAYVLPQAPELPMANRREDMLFRRP